MASTLVEFSNNLADAVERAGASVVGVLEGGSDGVSGTVWREDVAVTAEHTIRGREEVSVVLGSGERTSAKVIGRDPGTDIAVLKFSIKGEIARPAPDDRLRVGEIVLSVARRGTDGLATTFGVVSAISGPWRTWHGGRVDRWLRLDLKPFPGFSGGPIVNAAGEVLGIATSGPRRSVVTIPTQTVNRVVEQLLKGGPIARGYLGVGVQPVALPEGTRQALATERKRGLLVITIAPGSSAEKAGLLLGDVILSLDGATLDNVHGLQPALDPENVGKTVVLEIARGGKLAKVNVVVGEKPRS